MDGGKDGLLGMSRTWRLIVPLKEMLMPFQSKLIGLFQRREKRNSEVTSCKSKNCPRMPEYSQDNIILTSLQA